MSNSLYNNGLSRLRLEFQSKEFRVIIWRVNLESLAFSLSIPTSWRVFGSAPTAAHATRTQARHDTVGVGCAARFERIILSLTRLTIAKW